MHNTYEIIEIKVWKSTTPRKRVNVISILVCHITKNLTPANNYPKTPQFSPSDSGDQPAGATKWVVCYELELIKKIWGLFKLKNKNTKIEIHT